MSRSSFFANKAEYYNTPHTLKKAASCQNIKLKLIITKEYELSRYRPSVNRTRLSLSEVPRYITTSPNKLPNVCSSSSLHSYNLRLL